MERTNLTYGAMAKLCRDGGFWVCFDSGSSIWSLFWIFVARSPITYAGN